MAELKDRAEELKNEMKALCPAFVGLGRDIRAANARLDKIEKSAAFKRARARYDAESRLSSMMSTLERYQRMAEARNTMFFRPGVFSTARQAEAYNEAKRNIQNPNAARHAREEREYGKQGAKELRDLRAKEMFRKDTMNPFDREREMWTERYGGNADLAEKKMRHDALLGLPEFFKNSKLGVQELRAISKYSQGLPVIGKLMSGFSEFKAGIGSSGGMLGAAGPYAMGVKLGLDGIKYLREIGMEAIKVGARARAGGMDPVSYRSWDDVLSLTGGSGESALSVTKSWKTNVGALLSGRGGTEFLSSLATYGIDISGTGAGGLATDREMMARVAARIKNLRLGGEEERAMALARDAGFDEHMYHAAIRNGGSIHDLSNNFRGLNRLIQSGEDASWSSEFFVRKIEKAKEASKRVGIKFLTLDADMTQESALDYPYNSGDRRYDTTSGVYDASTLREDRAIRDQFMRWEQERRSKGKRAGYSIPGDVMTAALSSDAYDMGVIEPSPRIHVSTALASAKPSSMVMNVSTVQVSANDPQEFVDAMASVGQARFSTAKIFDPALS